MGKDDRKDRKRDRSRSDSRERHHDKKRSHKESRRGRSRSNSPSRRRDRRDDDKYSERSSHRRSRSRSRSDSHDRGRRHKSKSSHHSNRDGGSGSSRSEAPKAKTPQELEQEKEAQRANEQAALEEEMRKRRERVKAWQEAKRLAEGGTSADISSSSSNGVVGAVPASNDTADSVKSVGDRTGEGSDDKPHGWSLEDDEEEDQTIAAPQSDKPEGAAFATASELPPPLTPIKHADHISNLDRDVDDDEEENEALAKPAAVFKRIIATTHGNSNPSTPTDRSTNVSSAPTVDTMPKVVSATTTTAASATSSGGVAAIAAETAGDDDYDPLDAYMSDLYTSGDVEKQKDLPALLPKPAEAAPTFITFEQIMANLHHPGLPSSRQEDIEDEFTSGANLSAATNSTSRRVGDPRGWESDIGSESGANSPVRGSSNVRSGGDDAVGGEAMDTEDPEETEEQREEREEREKREFIEAIRRAREEEEEMREKLARMEETAAANAEKMAKNNIGRVFAHEGDVVDEQEIAEKKKGALELLEEARKGKMLKEIDHSRVDYIDFRKNLYIVPRAISKLTEQEANDLREQLHIKVRGRGCPTPVFNWEQCGLSDRLLQAIQYHELKEPFPIQKQAIPAIMCGRDVIGVAKTGSGKTLAFLLPMIRHILDQPPVADKEGPICLIMAPARELANQIYREAKKFAGSLGLRVACVYGGAAVAEQIGDLKRGAEIVVCTPGRMIDILTMQAGKLISLKRVTMVVLDEADRMFDMGFEPQIKMIIQNIRPDRQTVLFSATFPKQIEKLAKTILNKPLEIVVGERSTVNKDITQFIEVHEEDDKFLRLLQLLGLWYEKGSVLVFVDKQEKCDQLFQELLKLGYPCLSLHGGKDQIDREHTLHEFKTGIKTVMIATSVAGRGLDVPEIICVVNYNCPNHLEDYVHRVGRTGRAGRKGWAYTFISEKEEQYAPIMVKALEKCNAEIPAELAQMAAVFNAKVERGEAHRSGSGFVGKGFTFDANELNAEQQLKQNQKRAYDIEQGLIGNGEEEAALDEDDDDAPSGEQRSLVPINIAMPGTSTTYGFSSSSSNSGSAGVDTSVNMANLTPMEKAKLMAAQLAGRTAVVPTALPPGLAAPSTAGSGKVDAAAALARARMIASGMASGKIDSGLGLDLSQSSFAAEVEINEYPEKARRKITSRPCIDDITERTGAAIIARGTYVPKGSQPPPGERKLYLLIEGAADSTVVQAKLEVMRILEEETIKVTASGNLGGTAGRYSVL